jgi:hypothetical protein
MNIPHSKHSHIALAVMLCLALCSCGDDDPSNPPPDANCIGSAGGHIAVSDTNKPLYGVSLTVEPDDWQKCWSVYFNSNSTFTTPNFDDGLAGYDGMLTGSLELTIGRQVTWEQWEDAPTSLEFQLTFPLRKLTLDPGEKLTAFRYDEPAGLYRLVFPEEQDDQQLTISTDDYKSLWTWGKVDLAEVDFDTYLAPVMEDLHGEGVWLEIEAKLDSLRQAAIANQIQATCVSLEIVRSSLAAGRDASADIVRAIQDANAPHCGLCDATTPEFYEELSEYCQLKVEEILTDLFLGSVKNPFIRLYGFIMTEYKRDCIEQLDCDFECFAGAMEADFYYNLAIFHVSNLMVDLIDWSMDGGYINCP